MPAASLEGVVSKRLSKPYQSGQSAHWLKVKNPHSPAMARHRELVKGNGPRLKTRPTIFDSPKGIPATGTPAVALTRLILCELKRIPIILKHSLHA
jgi:hypothetical protein